MLGCPTVTRVSTVRDAGSAVMDPVDEAEAEMLIEDVRTTFDDNATVEEDLTVIMPTRICVKRARASSSSVIEGVCGISIANWTGDADDFNAGDGICHCDRGLWDPDCEGINFASPTLNASSFGCPADGNRYICHKETRSCFTQSANMRPLGVCVSSANEFRAPACPDAIASIAEASDGESVTLAPVQAPTKQPTHGTSAPTPLPIAEDYAITGTMTIPGFSVESFSQKYILAFRAALAKSLGVTNVEHVRVTLSSKLLRGSSGFVTIRYRVVDLSGAEAFHVQAVLVGIKADSLAFTDEIDSSFRQEGLVVPDGVTQITSSQPVKTNHHPLDDAASSTKIKTSNGQEKTLTHGTDYTTTCSHVKCTTESHADELDPVGYTKVVHHNKEQYGNQHICKYELHTSGKCGCECFSEAVGGWGFLTDTAATLVRRHSSRRLNEGDGVVIGYNY